MLEFLGVDQLADRKYYLAREKYLQSKQKETKTKSPDRDVNDLFDEDEPGQQNEEIFPTKSAPTGQISCKYSYILHARIIESIFKNSSSKMAAAAYKMPEDIPHSSLLIAEKDNETGSGTIPVEDNSELLT